MNSRQTELEDGRPSGLSSLRDGADKSSPPKASIPDAWRTDSPPYGKRPIWQYVFLQGSRDHMGDGRPWARAGWGTAAIRTNDAPDGLLGYRQSDIERICRDNDIDIWTAKVVGWLPMITPAALTEADLPPLAPCDDGEWSAQAGRATLASHQAPAGLGHSEGIPNAWRYWHDERPESGQKIAIVCDDGCSSSLALMADGEPLDGEDGEPLGEMFLRGAIWTALPDAYPLGFMEVTDADWF